MTRTPRTVWTLTLLLVALSMGLEFAHLLEWAPKASYPGPLYVRLQESLYVWFGDVGGVLYVLAILASLAVAVALRRDRGTRGFAASAVGLEGAALVVFFAVTYPVNQRFPVHGSGAVPADWATLRARWELAHAAGFVLFTAAFLLLVTALLASTAAHPHPGLASAPWPEGVR